MDFSWSAEQEALRDTVRRFARGGRALSSAIDRDSVSRRTVAGSPSWGYWPWACPLGWAAAVPHQIDLGIVVEELSRFRVAQLPIMGALTATAIARPRNRA
jgi:hypothetical protein